MTRLEKPAWELWGMYLIYRHILWRVLAITSAWLTNIHLTRPIIATVLPSPISGGRLPP